MEKYLTQEGLEKLKKELAYLKETKRAEISQRLEKCISFGDLSENSEYHETKEAQGFLEGRIIELEDIIKNAVIVPDEIKNNFAAVQEGVHTDQFHGEIVLPDFYQTELFGLPLLVKVSPSSFHVVLVGQADDFF